MSRRCFENHMGVWAIKPDVLEAAIAEIRAGIRKPNGPASASSWEHVLEAGALLGTRTEFVRAATAPRADVVIDTADDNDPYQEGYLRTQDGLAVLQLAGPMMKARSKFGGVSTVGIRRALRAAAADAKVSSIMLLIDSPGGTVAGTQELADDVRAIDRDKPVYAHIDDLGASAAYWVAAQARRVTANESAIVGSIGVFGVVYDSAKMFEEAGVTVHLLTTGPDKAVGTEGVPVTKEQLKPHQEYVDAIGKLFFGAVKAGRRLTDAQLEAVTSGRVWDAKTALGLHLLDRIGSFDAALAATREDLKVKAETGHRPRRDRAALAEFGFLERAGDGDAGP